MSHGKRRRVRSCGKRRFRDKNEALAALHRITARVSKLAGDKPVRAYPCDYCNGWHLTSQHTWKPA